MLELSASDPIIKAYFDDLSRLSSKARHELAIRPAFYNLLDRAARKRDWTLVQELSTYVGGKRVVPDGTLLDGYHMHRGWWEAKDTACDLIVEVQEKIKAGYTASQYPSRSVTRGIDTRLGERVKCREVSDVLGALKMTSTLCQILCIQLQP